MVNAASPTVLVGIENADNVGVIRAAFTWNDAVIVPEV